MGRHTVRLPPITGVRLPFTLNQLTATGLTAPATMVKSMEGEVGRNVVWNWNIPDEHVVQDKVPRFLECLYGDLRHSHEHDWRKRHRHRHSWMWWWHCHTRPTSTGHQIVQEMTNKQDPITIYNGSAGELATHVWIRLDLSRPETQKWFALAEVEFYESAEDAGSARLRITSVVSGAQANLIATTATLTNGSWQSATLTGGYDMYENPTHNQSIAIGARTYTFVTGAFSAPYQVAIATTGGTTLGNLIQAVNAGTGAGVLYSTGTAAHEFVSASAGPAEGSIYITSLTGVRAAVANALTLSATGTPGIGFMHGATLTGGVDGTYYADPGFSFTSIVSALDQGAQGLEVQISNETAELFLPDLRNGLWDKATATIQVLNWASPSGGAITLFGGRVGRINYDDTGFVTIEIDNQMSRDMRWPSENWSPTCRAQLGDHRCKFDIESMAKVGSISAVINSTEIRSLDINAPASHWQNGIIQILDGPNAGQAVELLFSEPPTITGGSGSGGLANAWGWIELKIKKKNQHKLTLTAYQRNKLTYYNPDDGYVITIGGKAYTFVAALVTGDGIVKIQGKAGKGCSKGDQTLTLEHLRDAMLLTASGSGVTYSTGTTAHTEVMCGDVEGERIEFHARVASATGNNLGISVSGNFVKRSGSTFQGGLGTPPVAVSGATDQPDTLILAQAFPFALTVGTHFKIWPGCQKRFIKDCRDRYHNTQNFRGEPFAPTHEGLVVQ